MMDLTLESALTIARATLEEGSRRGFAPLCAVVLDSGGRVLVVLRDHSASIGRPEIATAKAGGCLAMGFGGRELARRAQNMPGFFAGLVHVLPNGLLPVPGGVLIRAHNGRLIGALGVSGDTSDNDEICAVAGVLAASLVADTGDVAP